MPADILIAFAQPPAQSPSVSGSQWCERCAGALRLLPGVVATRSFTVNVVLGERTPAFYPALVICELDGAGYDSRAAAAALTSPDATRIAAWEGTSVGARSDFELPDHLYLQFSAQPSSLTFGQYSDWYQVHQDENIAQSVVLGRGWRYRLEPLGSDERPSPTHLALYELDGELETLTGDLGRAMAAGVISLPDWFTRFASLEGIATGERTAA
jgi:hypothetical protein